MVEVGEFLFPNPICFKCTIFILRDILVNIRCNQVWKMVLKGNASEAKGYEV